MEELWWYWNKTRSSADHRHSAVLCARVFLLEVSAACWQRRKCTADEAVELWPFRPPSRPSPVAVAVQSSAFSARTHHTLIVAGVPPRTAEIHDTRSCSVSRSLGHRTCARRRRRRASHIRPIITSVRRGHRGFRARFMRDEKYAGDCEKFPFSILSSYTPPYYLFPVRLLRSTESEF